MYLFKFCLAKQDPKKGLNDCIAIIFFSNGGGGWSERKWHTPQDFKFFSNPLN